MPTDHSKSEYLYHRIKQELLAGKYPPGDRIDSAALAKEHKTSQTPVRFALHRLVGEGLLEDQGRHGLLIPTVSEFCLRDLYDWTYRLLGLAFDIGFDAGKDIPWAFSPDTNDADEVDRIRLLFESICHATGHVSLYFAMVRVNDKLAPVRRMKKNHFFDTTQEFKELAQLWADRELADLQASLTAYHERRLKIVPNIVALHAGRMALRSLHVTARPGRNR